MAAVNRNDKSNAAEAAIPLMASALISGSGGDAEALKQIILELATEQLESKRKEKARKEKLALAAIQTVKEQEEQRKLRQNGCTHQRQDNTTRLSGQRLTGTGQLCLVCQFCHKEFFMPPLDGQEAAPRHLIPSADVIGG